MESSTERDWGYPAPCYNLLKPSLHSGLPFIVMLMMPWEKNSLFFVYFLVNESSAATQSQRLKKKLSAFLFLYKFEYIPLLSRCSTVSLWVPSLPGHFNESSRESGLRPMVGFFWEVTVFTVPIYPREALCGDEGHYKTEEDECQRPSWGTLREAAFPICGICLHWLAGMCPPACGKGWCCLW